MKGVRTTGAMEVVDADGLRGVDQAVSTDETTRTEYVLHVDKAIFGDGAARGNSRAGMCNHKMRSRSFCRGTRRLTSKSEEREKAT